MGMTPLEGLVMGTRARRSRSRASCSSCCARARDRTRSTNCSTSESGLAGLTGTARHARHRAARRAKATSAAGWRSPSIRTASASTSARTRPSMGGVDAIVFTGGIGENSALVRHRCLQRLGIPGRRARRGSQPRCARRRCATAAAIISSDESRVRLLVVRADEERWRSAAALAALRRSRDSCAAPDRSNRACVVTIPVAISARHAHLTQPTIDRLFGAGHELAPRAPLSQPGQFAARGDGDA